jgi:hypothetical protein
MWVADCPRECNNTERLTQEKGGIETLLTEFYCSYCKYSTQDLEWPKDMGDIEQVLSLRPIPHNRNWYPKDHSVAVRFKIPHGQSIEDLREENAAHNVPVK